MSNIRILYLLSGLGKPASIPFYEKYISLSKYFSGDIVFPIGKGIEHTRLKQIGNFNLHSHRYIRENILIRTFYSFFMTVLHALIIFFKERRYQIIVSTNPLSTGLVAILISKLTRSKVIIEINGNFESAYKYDSKYGFGNRLGMTFKDKISKHIISYVIKKADAVKLVYEKQLEPLELNINGSTKIFCFANFVPIRKFIESNKIDEGYILLLGYPWYLKGVDILIKAFNKISHEFPNIKLKIFGWCPSGREYFENLTEGNPNIELNDPVYYEDVIRLMTNCTLYVLASRTDSSPRVLREAMASKKPIVAADIDGVPDLIRDGFNGLLFRKEDVEDLADKMRKFLSDHVLAERLARNGLAYVQENLSEESYVGCYKNMVDTILS